MRQLIWTVIGAVDLRGQPAIAVNDGSGGVVADGAFVRPIDFAEGGGQRTNVAGGESPTGSGGPTARILGEHGGSVEVRIHSDGEERDLRTEAALQHGEISGEPRADVGQGTAGIDEIDCDNFA